MLFSKLHTTKGPFRQRLSNPNSSFARYRTIAVGQQGLGDLLAYELINTFILPLPGRLGIGLRSLLFPLICAKMGRCVTLGTDCTIRNPFRIWIEDHVVIEDGVTLDVKPHAHNLLIGRNVVVGRRTILNCAGGTLVIGNGTHIGPFCRLGSKKGLAIGKNCRIGEQVCCSGASHAYADRDRPIVEQAVTCKGPTKLGDFVIVGDRASILDGIQIGNNVRIAPDSLVTRDISDNSLVAGVPARIQQILN
jgi:acetyltransferase-like isoleucine patch superfamily enzyme